ncbi:MAG: hypothetical protein KDA44_22200, partial [Planctomycetales bacterium]|nr:hypothetical protein [Planctomycetales bacterium]
MTGPAVLAVLLCSAALGNDIGRWRMPSTVAQASAFGYGPGHHAPIVRAPGYRTPPAPRIVLAPPGQPPFCPQAYREIGGCGAGSCSAGYGAASH